MLLLSFSLLYVHKHVVKVRLCTLRQQKGTLILVLSVL